MYIIYRNILEYKTCLHELLLWNLSIKKHFNCINPPLHKIKAENCQTETFFICMPYMQKASNSRGNAKK